MHYLLRLEHLKKEHERKTEKSEFLLKSSEKSYVMVYSIDYITAIKKKNLIMRSKS